MGITNLCMRSDANDFGRRVETGHLVLWHWSVIVEGAYVPDARIALELGVGGLTCMPQCSTDSCLTFVTIYAETEGFPPFGILRRATSY